MINEKNDTVFQKIVHFVSISLFSWSFTLAVTAVTIMQILPKVSQRKCPGVGELGISEPVKFSALREWVLDNREVKSEEKISFTSPEK